MPFILRYWPIPPPIAKFQFRHASSRAINRAIARSIGDKGSPLLKAYRERLKPSLPRIPPSFSKTPFPRGEDQHQRQHQQPYQQEHQQPYQQEHKQPHQREHEQPYQREHKQPYQREHEQPYKREHKQLHQREHEQPYQREQKQPYQREQKQPYQREQKQPYQREQKQPYQREHQQPHKLQQQNPFPKPDPYPDALLSTTSIYDPISQEERQTYRNGVQDEYKDDDLIPPIPSIQKGIHSNRREQSPRLDRPPPGLRSPPILDTRRQISKVHPGTGYIFGSSVVEAALRNHRRKLYRLYIYTGENRSGDLMFRAEMFKALAKKNHPNLEVINELDIGKLDSMTNSRPHNGFVIECDPIIKIPVLSLGPVSQDRSSFGINLVQHTKDDRINLNSLMRTFPCRDNGRYPFVVMMDEILDPGNLGAMVRSIYYFGGDALVVSSRKSAPLSPVAHKSASGSAEYLPIFMYVDPQRFVTMSQANGWVFYAALPLLHTSSPQEKHLNHILDTEIGNPLRSHPCVLILGQEGQGLRSYLSNKANYKVSIVSGPGTSRVVDSLNVSVACGVLCSRFLQPGNLKEKGVKEEGKKTKLTKPVDKEQGVIEEERETTLTKAVDKEQGVREVLEGKVEMENNLQDEKKIPGGNYNNSIVHEKEMVDNVEEEKKPLDGDYENDTVVDQKMEGEENMAEELELVQDYMEELALVEEYRKTNNKENGVGEQQEIERLF